MPLNYIVPAEFDHFAILNGDPPCSGCKESFPGLPDVALFTVSWPANSQDREAALEAMPGVIPLGYPWEPLPAEAVPVLSAVHDALTTTQDLSVLRQAGMATKSAVAPAETDSVGRALHKLGRRQY